MPSSVTRQTNGSIDIKLKLAWVEIEKELARQTSAAVSQIHVPGFRKGKAPKDRVEPQLDKSQLLSKSLSELLPAIYTAAVNTAQLKPILYPQITIDAGKWGQDFEFTATTCEAPVVTLPENYSDAIKKLEFSDPTSPLPTILEYFRKNSHIQIPEPLVSEEVNHRLGHLAENLSQLGMDMAKYLASKKITAEGLKSQTVTQARSDLELEFILGSVQANQKLPDRNATLDFLKGLLKT